MSFIKNNNNNSNVHNIITVPGGNHRMINIPIDEYINCINSFEISMDTPKICKQLNINKIQHLLFAGKSSLNFLLALRGQRQSQYKNECALLDLYNIGIQPVYTEYIKKHIAKIKWIVYINIKNNIIDKNVISNIALLSGLCLYFNECDVIDTRNTNINNNNHISNIYNNDNNNYNFSNRMQTTTKNLYNITQKYIVQDINM